MLIVDPMRKESASAPVDRAVAALARRQWGVVARRQLRELGVTDRGVAQRVAAGRLHRIHTGVYAVGHTVLGARGRWMAAILACGPTAVLSHAAAGALWELRGMDAMIIDVTVPGTGGRQRRTGIRVHRARSLQTTTKDGIPVTTPGRTILDLAATLDRRSIERLLDRAEHQRLGDDLPLDALARAHAGHRGAHRLLQTLQEHHPGTTLTRSELDERFLNLCRAAGLPRPRCNHHVEGLEVDFVFAGHGLLVETDSWRHHRSRESFESDRRRDAIHAAAGWRTLRFTHRQIEAEPAEVARAIAAVLALALGPHANFARSTPLGPDDQPPTAAISSDW
jgi:very-short-patch-repair endonuclease